MEARPSADMEKTLPPEHQSHVVSYEKATTALANPDDHGFSPDEQKRIMRRIDRRLVVTVGAMYCVSLMDRTNMSAANIAGMSVELNLDVNYRYVSFLYSMHVHRRIQADFDAQNIANLVFFIPYIIFQPPSTILVRAIGPRIHLAAITLFWGAVMIGMGFVKNFGELAGARVLLGLLEAGFFPSCVYLLSTWYTRCKWRPQQYLENSVANDGR